MPCCKLSVNELLRLLDPLEVQEVVKLAATVDELERKWQKRLDSLYRKMTDRVVEELLTTGRVNESNLQFEDFFMRHFFETASKSIKSTRKRPKLPSKLANYPKGPMPRSLKDLMVLWDKWRKRKEVPARQKKIIKDIKRAYISRVQEVWKKYSEDFRRGDIVQKKEIVDKIKRASNATKARSSTIVNTETTRYWNDVRVETYSESEDVTHFLFVAVRDFRTTKWCKTRQGLVYTKDTQLLKKNKPPCHWNCRSEVLPLTPLNPKHKLLIADRSRRAENNRPEPLPVGWNK